MEYFSDISLTLSKWQNVKHDNIIVIVAILKK